MKTLACLAFPLILLLASTAHAQDRLRVYVGPMPSAAGIVPPESNGARDSHRDITRALNNRKGIADLAQIVEDAADADVVLTVDARSYSAWSGKKLMVTAKVVGSNDTAIFDGTKGFVGYYRVQAGRIAEQAEKWMRTNTDAILALRK